MKQGELWLVEIPPTNGYEQSGLRPVLVVSPVEANIVMIIPLTSNVSALRYPHTFEVLPSEQNGLKTVSIVLIFQLRAIDQKRLQRKIGYMEVELLKRIDGMLKQMLALT
jgi:mRNA interferase MazF